MDGTDFKIHEPKPFNKKWYSHKFKAAGLRYEIGICIRTGKIVWIHGPFPCGDWPDLKIFRSRLKLELGDDEQVEADKGYRGEPKCRLPNEFHTESDKVAKTTARMRHEGVNGSFKNFGILKQTFRGERKRHKSIFLAIAVLVEIGIECGFHSFSVSY